MAQLKSTIVQGALTVTSNVVANKIIKNGGAPTEVLIADGSTKTIDQLATSIDTGVTDISVTGEGNAITAASISSDTRTLTLTKDTTFVIPSDLNAYVTIAGDETITGTKTFTPKQVFTGGADFQSRLNFTQNATIVWPAKDQTNKYFSLGADKNIYYSYDGETILYVTPAGNLNISGAFSANSATITNNVTAKGFVAKNSSDDYVLLAGGGTKTIESFKSLVTIPTLTIADNNGNYDAATPIIGGISVNDHKITVVRKSLADLGLSTVYKFQGSCLWAELLALPKADIGDVYNITDADENGLTGSDWACCKAFTTKIQGDKYANYWQSIGGINDWQGMLNGYLPLTGSSYTSTDDTTKQPNNMMGPIVFYDVDGIKINSKDSDRKIWEVYGYSGSYRSSYGFDLLYKGTGSGINNTLVLNAHNTTGNHIPVYEVNQLGVLDFKVRPTYSGTQLALITEVPEDTNTWRPIDVVIGETTNSLTDSITSSKLTLKQGTNIVMTYSDGLVTLNAAAVADSVDSDEKLYLIGAKAQGTNQTTFSDSEVYVTNGVLTTSKTQVGGGVVTMEYDNSYKALKFVFA